MTLSSRPIPTNRNNPCPICDDAKGKCRILDDGTVFCFTHADAKLHEVINGYKCIKEASGHTATFKPDNSGEWTSEKRREWKEQQQRRIEENKRKHQELIKQLLPIEERSHQYRLINNGLSSRHKKRLSDRGLAEDEVKFALEQGWLFTWQPGIEVSGISPRLAGASKGVQPKLLGASGIFVAAMNEKHVIGAQIATDDRERLPKYLWLSSASKGGCSPHLPNGELPLFVWRHPEAKEINETWLVEGSLKSLITALKAWFRWGRKDVQIIGAAGANFAGSQETLKEALEAQTTKKVVLFPDGGSLKNDHILNQYKKALELTESLGFENSVAWWEQFEKAKNDIDEIPDDDFQAINYITTDEFICLEEPVDSKVVETHDGYWKQWIKSREFTPDIKLDQEQLQLPKIPKVNAIIAINSGLGTGKTHALLKEIESSENPAMIIGYRNNLLFQTIKRGEEAGVNIYHLREDDGAFMLSDNSTHQAFCLDSVCRADGYFQGRDIYLDETCSVLSHAVNGGTLGDEQAKVIKVFSKALQECNRVILLDGNLSDLYVDFIDKLAPNKRVIRIKNERKIKPHDIIFVEGVDLEGEIKKNDKSPLIKKLLRQSDIKPWIFSDSKEYTKVLEKLLIDFGKRGYVLNSETAGEDWAKEFLADPNNFILDKKPDFIIISPTAESGVSVTVNGYFTHKFSFFAGVQGTNSQHQAMFRLRDNSIPHYVFCPERSMVKDRSNPHTYSVKKFQQELNDRIMQSSFLASQNGENPDRVSEVIGQAIARQNDHWWEFSAKLGALDNFEMNNLRKCLIHSLEEAGHDVSIEQWEVDECSYNLQKQAKEKVQRQYAEELDKAIEYESVDEARKIAKSSPRKLTQRRIEKTFLLDKLPGIKEHKIYGEEFIYECYVKNKHFITQQQRYWFLKNFEISQKRHEVAWHYQATKEYFFGARVKRMPHDVIWALKELDILQFEELGEYNKNTEEVVDFVKLLRKRKDVQLALNIRLEPETATGDERLRILANLLNLIGFKNKFTEQKQVNGIKLRHYTCQPIAQKEVKEREFNFQGARTAILEAIERKFTAWMQSDKSKVNWEEEASTNDQPNNQAFSDYNSQQPSTTPPLLLTNQGGVAPVTDSTDIPNMNVADDKELWNESALADEEVLNEIANDLILCGDIEAMAEIRTIYPKKGLVEASKRLQPEIRARVMQWVVELNKDNPSKWGKAA